MTGFPFTNNAAPHGTYGINGAGASSGTLTLQMYFPGAVMTGNWLSGGQRRRIRRATASTTPFDVRRRRAGAASAPSCCSTVIAQGLMTADAAGAGEPAASISSGR